MHRIKRCPRCREVTEEPFKNCVCTEKEMRDFYEKQMQDLENAFNPKHPTVAEAKNILKKAGYTIKKRKR